MKKFAAWVILIILASGLVLVIGYSMPSLKKVFSNNSEITNSESSLPVINNHIKLMRVFKKSKILDANNNFKLKIMVLRMGQQMDSYLFEIRRDENKENEVLGISMAYTLLDDSEQKGNMLICSSSINTPKIVLPSSNGNNAEVILNPLEKVKYWDLCNKKAEELIPFFEQSLPQFGLTLEE